ncbi:isocitrate dehydrogenase [Cutibacterium acnes JCM 18918]|nr:isocitrate dehydrogenase [Cutibacterium acnes JCM 18918]
MDHGDFFDHEESFVSRGQDLDVVLIRTDGSETTLASGIKTLDGEIVDATFMSVDALDEFYASSLAQANEEDLLWSVHLKATMMKVSDPVLFGHAVRTFLVDVFDKYGDDLNSVGVNPDLGLGDLYTRLEKNFPQNARLQLRRPSILPSLLARPWPWSTPTMALPICMPEISSLSTLPCQLSSAIPDVCGTPKVSVRRR